MSASKLLTTKFHIPHRRSGLVARPRLLEELQRGWAENRKLTLISAPAGYGKTTLVTEWLNTLFSSPSPGGRRDRVKISWLSLDEVDNEPARFLRYFLGALQQVNMTIGAQLEGMLDMPNLPPLPSLLDDLLNDLASLDSPFVLVLDDYHVITNSQIHAALDFFLEHQPASTHLVVVTRADPPLPLARLRARRQMTELRARDLRFTPEEACAFFGLANLPLAEDALRALDERTEGWAAGLQLAALALQHQPDPAVFIETFRGSHRYVLDYLAWEVIQQQSEEIRAFLTQTSILDRFNADLCNALTGRDDSQDVITRLEQSNLFIIPLDDERRWYRYHHLFADYLNTLLAKPEKIRLYKAASQWHALNNSMVDAVRFALTSTDIDFAADVIEQALSCDSTWSDGNLAGLTAWLEALPSEAIRSRPRLGLHTSRVWYLQGRFDEAEKLLVQTKGLLQSQPRSPENEILSALIDLYHGAIAAVRGDFQKAIAIVPAAQARIPSENHLAHARAFFSLGLAHEIAEQTALAIENYLRSSAEARAAGVLFLDVHGLCAAAQLQIAQGRLNMAAQTCRQAIQLAEGVHLPPLGLAWSILGAIALERNDLDSAERLLQEGIALSRKGGLLDDVVTGLASLGRLRAYQGDADAMRAVVDEVQSFMRNFGIPRGEQLARAHLARFQLFLGQCEAAMHWADEYRSLRAEPFRNFDELTLARIYILTGNLDPLPGILNPLLEKATAAGQMQTALEAMILLGLYRHAQGEIASALEWLEKALELAAPEGYIRVFLDGGPPLLELLPRIRRTAPELVDAILNSPPSPAESPTASLLRLPDPLSKQEIRVLKLIMAGKSNAEIAAELVISVGTAKWHVHNILQKLGVSNRPQAIARANELGF